MSFESSFINRIASGVLAVYVFSFGFQRLVYLVLPLENYAFSPLLFPLICVFAPCVVTGCIVIDLVRQKVFGTLESKIAKKLADILGRWIASGMTLFHKIKERLLLYVER